MKQKLTITLKALTLFTIAALGLFLTFGDTPDLAVFILTKALAVPVWMLLAVTFLAFNKGGALTSLLPPDLLTDE